MIRRFLANAALVFFSLVIAVALGELALRIFVSVSHFSPEHAGQSKDYEGLANSQRAYGFQRSNARLQTNSLGFRGPEFSLDKSTDGIRIIMLGDSITAGTELDWQQTTSAQLQNILQSMSLPSLSVYNLGVTGYNTHQQLATLIDVGVDLSPDIVILNLCLNDSDPIMTLWQAGLMRKARISNMGDINLRTIVGSSYLLTFLKGQFVELLKRTSPSSLHRLNNPAMLIDKRVSETAWTEMKEAITKMRSISEANNASFLVAIYPYASQVGLPKEEQMPQQDLAKFFEEKGIKYVDLMDAYSQAEDEMFSDHTLHLSPYGSKQTAKLLVDQLLEAGFINPQSD